MSFSDWGASMGQRLRSRPLRVHWAGFESDTYRMEQAGWQISAEQDIQSMTIRLAFARGNKTPGMVGDRPCIRAISHMADFDYYRSAHDPMWQPDIVIELEAVASRVHIHSHNGAAIRFKPINATPQLWQGEITSLDDLAHFVPRDECTAKQIVVAEPEVDELLAMILKKQQPMKEKIIRDQVYEERSSGLVVPKVHAEIISLKDYKAA